MLLLRRPTLGRLLALATFNEKKDAWSWLPGKYTVFVGGSSRDLPLQAQAALH